MCVFYLSVPLAYEAICISAEGIELRYLTALNHASAVRLFNKLEDIQQVLTVKAAR